MPMPTSDALKRVGSDTNDVAPTSDTGEYICGRECIDGTRCMAPVSLPLLSCYQHDTEAPLFDA